MPPYKYAIIRACKYVSINVCMYAIMQVYRFTGIEVSTLQVWNHGNIHVKEDKSIQVCRAGMQINKCVCMPLCIYTSIQICKKENMKNWNFASFWFCDHTTMWVCPHMSKY